MLYLSGCESLVFSNHSPWMVVFVGYLLKVIDAVLQHLLGRLAELMQLALVDQKFKVFGSTLLKTANLIFIVRNKHLVSILKSFDVALLHRESCHLLLCWLCKVTECLGHLLVHSTSYPVIYDFTSLCQVASFA
jgi:hypothetical protein